MEGEGYFGVRRGRDLVASLSMTDKDVVEKFSSLFGFGVPIKERALPSGKIAYTWTSTNQRQTAGFFMTMLALMGKRRAEKIAECLVAWKEKPLPKKMWTQCKHGHELFGKNLRINKNGNYMKRSCVECSRLRTAKYRANKITLNASGIFAI